MVTRFTSCTTGYQSLRLGALIASLMIAIGCGGQGGGGGGGELSGAFAITNLTFPGAAGQHMDGILSPDGSTIAAVLRSGGNWSVWNRKDGWKDTKILWDGRSHAYPQLSSDGKAFMVNTADTPFLFSNGTAMPLQRPPSSAATAFAFSPDGRRILGATATSGMNSGSGKFIEWTNGSAPVEIPGPFPFGGLTIGYVTPSGYAADGVTPVGYTKVFVLKGGHGLPNLEYDHTLYWSIHDGSETDNPAISGYPNTVSPNGRTFASTSVSGGNIWDMSGATHPFALTQPANDVLVSAVDDAGDVVAGEYQAHQDTAIPWIWDAAHGSRLATDVLNANGLAVQFEGLTLKGIVGLSADGKTLVLDVTDSAGANSFALVHLAGK
jgi:WD40 repeat protein